VPTPVVKEVRKEEPVKKDFFEQLYDQTRA